MELSLRFRFTTPELLQLLQYRKDGKSYSQIAALLRGHSKVECQKIRQEIEDGMRDQQQSHDAVTESMRWSHRLQQIVDGQSAIKCYDRRFQSQQSDYHSKTHDRATSTSQESLLGAGYQDGGSLHKLAQNEKGHKIRVAGTLAWNDNEDGYAISSARKGSTNQTKSPKKTTEKKRMGKSRNKIQVSAIVHHQSFVKKIAARKSSCSNCITASSEYSCTQPLSQKDFPNQYMTQATLRKHGSHVDGSLHKRAHTSSQLQPTPPDASPKTMPIHILGAQLLGSLLAYWHLLRLSLQQ